MESPNRINTTKIMAEMTDDLLFQIIVTKIHPDVNNESHILPFIHAHLLELSMKAACLKVGVNDQSIIKAGHKIEKISKLLNNNGVDLSSWFPSPIDFENADSLFTKNDRSTLPNPNQMGMCELAFFIKYNSDLKYGFHKDFLQISNISLRYQHLNPNFMKLFLNTRNVYRTAELDKRLYEICKSHLKLIGFSDVDINSYVKNLVDESIITL